MNSINSITTPRLKKLLPELPTELATVVMLYATGATQEYIAGVYGYPSRRSVAAILQQAVKVLDLESLQAIRTVVQIRLHLALLELMDK